MTDLQNNSVSITKKFDIFRLLSNGNYLFYLSIIRNFMNPSDLNKKS